MKVAIAILNDRISPVFDVSRTILVLDIENGEVKAKDIEVFASDNPAHKISKLSELEVQTLICGAITRQTANMLTASGIQTISFVAGHQEDVIAAYLAGTLPNSNLTMPGLCGEFKPHG
jgi:predicted Fe-Mo cluster-binding NifX family protein